MNCRNLTFVTLSILLAGVTYAANPFLDTPDDKPVPANFRGTEWGDTIGEGEIPLIARVVTTRIAKMPWGAIFKIEFGDLKSRAPEPRKIEPEYFIVTADRIILLNEETFLPRSNEFRHWTSRQNSSRTKFTGSLAVN